jgi:hypothetical protein
MKRFSDSKMFVWIGSFFLISILVLGLLPSKLAFADSNKLYITPASSQMNVGTSFTVNVGSFASTDETTGSVSGKVIYSTNQLQVTSISIGSSDYGSPTISQATGTISFNGSRNPAPSGLAPVFSITFQAKAAGNATVGFDGSSEVNGQSTTYTTSTFTITSPSTPPASTPAPSTSTPPKTTTTTPAPVVTTPVTSDTTSDNTSQAQITPDPTGVVNAVVVTPSYTSAVITWKINAQNPTSTLVYGEDSATLTQKANVVPQAGGAFTTTITGLTPGQQYYFSISGGGLNTATGTYTSTIQTQGFPVVIKITENKIAAGSAQVQIGATSYTTQADGTLSIGLAAGSYSGKITTNTATLSINLTVAAESIPTDGSAPASQPFSFNLSSSALSQGPGASTTILTFVGILLGGTVILVFALLIFINIRRRKFDTTTDAYNPGISAGPTVIVDDGYNWKPSETQGVSLPLPPPDLLPPTLETPPHHANSVYLTEAEPLDMFEQAKLHQEPTPTPAAPGTGQSPNLPHSTMP